LTFCVFVLNVDGPHQRTPDVRTPVSGGFGLKKWIPAMRLGDQLILKTLSYRQRSDRI
jgi:hypothetical protein